MRESQWKPKSIDGGERVRNSEYIAIGIDPGRVKCGIAVVGESSGVLWSGIVSASEVDQCVAKLLKEFGANAILVGGGTGSKEIIRRLIEAGVDDHLLIVTDERFTTLEARRRYFKEHPPKGWRRLIPISLQTPPEPYDHYAAILLVERHMAKRAGAK